ncbi:hypothetical protein MLD38_003349 [Melastoma candidum]|uniref:Uncharacterized protein n=1 Tax=Melastoma candidum TaxID=119954 RepID=A0ACB9S3N0_9MYRT|nr:hypothetical protein MLD38_003349 [Melastoma candidum]
MSAFSFMEWNSKTPLAWEWDNMVMCNSKAAEASKTLRTSDWSIVNEELVDGEPLYASGFGSGSSFFHTSADLGYTSMSKSSKSASLNSSSTTEMKISSALLDASDGSLQNNKNIAAMAALSGTSPAVESSVCSGEPLLGLKLGKRIYFEDAYEAHNPKGSDCPLISKSPGIPAKRLRSISQGSPGPRCQVHGCNLDLSSAKEYHRKHKVCESHSKCPKVIVNGIERRFCQQCSRFHGLSEFDEKKRSCRKRLSDHNARRRKPQPDLMQINAAHMPSLFYGRLRQVNPSLGKMPLAPVRSDGLLSWTNSSSSGLMQRGESVLNSKVPISGSIDEPLHLLNDGTSATIKSWDALNGGSGGVLSFKSTEPATLGDGSRERMISFTLDGPRDVDRALSLLSTTTNSHQLLRPKAVASAHGHPFATNTEHATRIDHHHPPVPSICQSPPVASTGYWQADRTGNPVPGMANHQNGVIGNVPDFFLPDAQHDIGFDSIRLN